MTDEATATSVPLPDSPRTRVNKALAQLTHPGNLGVADQMHAMKIVLMEMATTLLDLLPTEEPAESPHA